jgi:hypothetical protein
VFVVLCCAVLCCAVVIEPKPNTQQQQQQSLKWAIWLRQWNVKNSALGFWPFWLFGFSATPAAAK